MESLFYLFSAEFLIIEHIILELKNRRCKFARYSANYGLAGLEMSKKKKSILSTLGAQITSMVSVCLVLIVSGVLALGGVFVHEFSRSLKERVGFTVIMNDSVCAPMLQSTMKQWSTLPYVSAYKHISPEQALERWKQSTGDEENIVDLLGVNPFRHEFEVNVKDNYSNMDSLRVIIEQVKLLPGVSEIRMQSRMIHNINRAIRSVAIVLSIVAVILLIISVVLINNMVRLSIYARRFVINTMKVVGATAWFIRRPFIFANLINGILSGAIAVIVLIGILGLIYNPGITSFGTILNITPGAIIITLASVFIAGPLICSLAAFFATNRYLRLDRDSLYK